MPWLKPEEWQLWDSENLAKQETIAYQNVMGLIHAITQNGIEDEVISLMQKRRAQYQYNQTALEEKATTRCIFELQRDLAVLDYFIQIWLWEKVWELDFEDKNGLTGQVERIMADENMTPTFPQMVRDAQDAIKSDGKIPPAEEMTIYKVIDGTRGSVVIIHQIDGNISHPEAVEFDAFVEKLRDTIDISSASKDGKYNANTEIDRILSLKLDYGQKITEFHHSKILKPYLK